VAHQLDSGGIAVPEGSHLDGHSGDSAVAPAVPLRFRVLANWIPCEREATLLLRGVSDARLRWVVAEVEPQDGTPLGETSVAAQWFPRRDRGGAFLGAPPWSMWRIGESPVAGPGAFDARPGVPKWRPPSHPSRSSARGTAVAVEEQPLLVWMPSLLSCFAIQ
jgi:hypothetical protein